ncbi:hypothetical protein G9P44_004520 [Scheffersomyces stipitis]|nr:hypothetical protein G9P44_004520 [Scheffersomyces stipitis]
MTNQLTLEEQLEGLPLFQLVIIGCLQIGQSIAFSSMYPCIYSMVKYFDIADNDSQIATYSGYLAAAFSLGEYVSLSYWSSASNIYGRKTILLCGCAGTAFSIVLYGFSTNFYIALFARLLMGICSGNTEVLRITIDEIAPEDRHKGFAFGNIFSISNKYKFIGYSLGVLGESSVSKSASKSRREDGFSIPSYPFLLPSLIAGGFVVFFINIGWLFLEETHERIKYERDIGINVGDSIRRLLRIRVPERPWNSREQYLKVDHQLLEGKIDSSELPYYPTKSRSLSVEVADFEEPSQSETGTETSDPIALPAVRNRMINNFMFCFHGVFYFEFLPILLATKLRIEDMKFPFHVRGGFGYSSIGIGILVNSSAGIGSCVAMWLIVFVKYCGIKPVSLGLIVYPIVYFLLPLLLFTSHQYNNGIPEYVPVLLLFIIILVDLSADLLTISRFQIFFDTTSSKEEKQLISRYSIRVISLAKCLAPIIGGWMISKSETHGYSELPWWALSVWSTITLLHSNYIDKSAW